MDHVKTVKCQHKYTTAMISPTCKLQTPAYDALPYT
jgi:hypothetical protein